MLKVSYGADIYPVGTGQLFQGRSASLMKVFLRQRLSVAGKAKEKL